MKNKTKHITESMKFTVDISDSGEFTVNIQDCKNFTVNISDCQNYSINRQDCADRKMSKQERILILIHYIINKIHSCPFEDESGVDFEKECVGFGEDGCGDCIYRNTDKLNCK